MRFSFLFLVVVFFAGCGETQHPGIPPLLHDSDSVKNPGSLAIVLPFDSIFSDSLYPAFDFGNGNYGFIVKDGSSHRFDSLLYAIAAADDSLMQKAQVKPFHFANSSRLQQLLQPVLPKTVFLCGEKGTAPSATVDVQLFSLPCMVYAVLVRVKPEQHIGHLLWCSLKPLNLDYTRDAAAQAAVDRIDRKQQAIQFDPTPYHVFAQRDSLFYAYADNFRWAFRAKDSCLYPERIVFTLKNDTGYVGKRRDGVDLNGDECD